MLPGAATGLAARVEDEGLRPVGFVDRLDEDGGVPAQSPR